MGTHTDRTDCQKCDTKDSLILSYDTRNPACNEALCLSCGWSYETVEKKISQQELKELRKEYDWKKGD